MICIIASSYKEAERWAAGQLLKPDEYFIPTDRQDIIARKDFHVIVVGDGDIPNGYLNDMLNIAWKRGRMK
jgi:hypothetical protein